MWRPPACTPGGRATIRLPGRGDRDGAPAERRSLPQPPRAIAAALAAAGIKSVTAIGDAFAPATIAHAVYAGHRYARELDAAVDSDRPFGRELPLASA